MTDEIPDYQLPASTGQTLSRDSFLGKVPTVTVYLADLGSHGDVTLAKEINRRLKEFGEMRSQVLGVAKETARAVRNHAEQHGLKFPILADASGSMRRSLGVEPRERVVVIAARDGRIVERLGYDPTQDEAETLVAQMLTLVREL